MRRELKEAQYSYLFACSSSNYTSSHIHTVLLCCSHRKSIQHYTRGWSQPGSYGWTVLLLQDYQGCSKKEGVHNNSLWRVCQWALSTGHGFLTRMWTLSKRWKNLPYLLLWYDVMYVYCYTILYAICWLYLGSGHSLYYANLYYASVWLLKLPACFTHSIFHEDSVWLEWTLSGFSGWMCILRSLASWTQTLRTWEAILELQDNR